MNKHGTGASEATRLAHAWASARYVAHATGQPVPFAVGDTAPAVERRWPAARYLFISAWNPAAVTATRQRNQLADQRLQAHLRQQGLAVQPASASDADGGCHEAGWLVLQATLSQADRLARAFGQGGVLVWEAGQAVRLRMMWPRPASAPLHPYIDWVG